MLYVCLDICKFGKFKKIFYEKFSDKNILDISKIPSHMIADECSTILQHHSDCAIFLGYVEGWMLTSPMHSLIRAVFRKFPVGFVCHYAESIPFSWKNGIDILYTEPCKDGVTCIVHNGCAIQD